MTRKINTSLSRNDAVRHLVKLSNLSTQGKDGVSRNEVGDSNPVLSQLYAQYLIYSRFSHSIRSHLGVAMNVVDDLLQGFPLSRTEMEDARTALRSSLKTINNFRDLTIKPNGEFIQISLYDFFTQYGRDEFLQSKKMNSMVKLQEEHQKRVLHPQLLSRALCCVISYIEAKMDRYSQSDEKRIQLELTNLKSLQNLKSKNDVDPIIAAALSKDTSEVITLSCFLPECFGSEMFQNATTFRELAVFDQSIDSLGLLFAEEVFAIHGACTLCSCQVNDGIRMVLFHIVF